MIGNVSNVTKLYDFINSSNGIALIAAIVSTFALLVSILSYIEAIRVSKIDMTTDLWAAWISKDYRAYRVDAFHAIRSAKENADSKVLPSMSDLLRNRQAEEAIGSIEHFFDESSKLMREGLLNKKLFLSLFQRSTKDWWILLSGFDRGTGKDSFTDEELDYAFGTLLGGIDKPGSEHRFSSVEMHRYDRWHRRIVPKKLQILLKRML